MRVYVKARSEPPIHRERFQFRRLIPASSPLHPPQPFILYFNVSSSLNRRRNPRLQTI